MRVFEKAIVIDEPWVSQVLGGQKVWEMRSKRTRHRGPIAIIRKGSGQVMGTASLINSLPALSRPEFTKYEGSIGFRGRSRMTPSDEGGASPGCLERRGRFLVRCRIRIALGRWSGSGLMQMWIVRSSQLCRTRTGRGRGAPRAGIPRLPASNDRWRIFEYSRYSDLFRPNLPSTPRTRTL